MGIGERLEEMETGTLLALGLAVAVVGLVFLVVVTVVLAAVIGTFVLGVGEDVETNVQAGASVTQDPATDDLEVVWTSNQNAGHLLVEWTAPNGTVEPVEVSGGASVDGDTARLEAVGDAVTLSDDAPDVATGVQIRVTAVGGDERTVVLTRELYA